MARLIHFIPSRTNFDVPCERLVEDGAKSEFRAEIMFHFYIKRIRVKHAVLYTSINGYTIMCSINTLKRNSYLFFLIISSTVNERIRDYEKMKRAKRIRPVTVYLKITANSCFYCKISSAEVEEEKFRRREFRPRLTTVDKCLYRS